MKVLGIEIVGREVRMAALENVDGTICNCTGTYKPITMADDDKAENVILFKNTLHAAIQNYAPDNIVIKYRNPNGKGRHAPSPLSFKIEGLIQIYGRANVLITKPQTISAYYKKNNFDVTPEFGYQTEAMKLAHHFIKTNN